MRLMSFSLLMTLAALLNNVAAATDPKNLDLSKAWFKPNATVSTDGICDDLQSDVEKYFQTSGEWSSYQFKGNKRNHLEAIKTPYQDNDKSMEADGSDWRKFKIKNSKGEQLFVDFQLIPGCGGACEGEAFLVSDIPFQNLDFNNPNEKRFASTPNATSWTLYKGAKDMHYVMGMVDNHIQFYKVTSPKKWRLTCEISVTPENLKDNNDQEVSAVLNSIDKLNRAVYGLTRGSGSFCGSMRTADRWHREIEEELHQTLYRPWSMKYSESVVNAIMQSSNSFGDYKRIYEHLKEWSLGGISEYQAFEKYNKQFAETTDDLSRFYSSKFGWSDDKSKRMAIDAMTHAISQGIGFYMYSPFSNAAEEKLRKAIVEHDSMDAIRKIKVKDVNLNGILDIAVQYPEVLQYLLEKGANPNVINPFGKTPLMYAAQYNNLDAVEILLSHGANPNAATTWPEDTCYYTLSTSRMTALHYAVRYASPTIIKLLISHGAITFNKTEKLDGQSESPLDWLNRYGVATSSERNLNISDADFAELATLLQMPSQLELGKISAEYTKKAEAEYAAGKIENSYSDVVIALRAQPDNQKAMSNLPIIALQSGRIGESLEASDAVLEKINNPNAQATAWFNKGLACEKAEYKFVSYNGKYYCTNDKIQPFLQSWKLSHSDARLNKLKSVLENVGKGTCQITNESLGPTLYHFELIQDGLGQNARIYIYHAPNQIIDSSKIRWPVQVYDPKTKLYTPTMAPPIKFVETINFKQFAVTVLQSDIWPTQTVSIQNQSCTVYE